MRQPASEASDTPWHKWDPAASPHGKPGQLGKGATAAHTASTPAGTGGSAHAQQLFSLASLEHSAAAGLPAWASTQATDKHTLPRSSTTGATARTPGSSLVTAHRQTAAPQPRPLGATTGTAAAAASPHSSGRPSSRALSAAATEQRAGVSALGSPAEDADLIPGVETGEQVVAYYAQHGQDAPVKFFYLLRAAAGPRYRPYDLAVVPRSAVGRHYLTMSATGVMALLDGTQSEFTPLAGWVRQRSLFDAISAIGFFRNFITGRAFRRWHKAVRTVRFRAVRAAIGARLFAAKPSFAPGLREVAAAAAELAAVAFAAAAPNHTYTLSEYGELQVATREQRAKPALEALAEKVQRVLERVCASVTATAALYQESIRDVAELADTTGVEVGGGGGSGPARPMVVIKAEKIERAANYARAMQEVQLLGNFIRLADYLLTEGVVERALTAGEDLLAALVAPRGGGSGSTAARPLFVTTFAFAPMGSAVFAPTVGEVLEEINHNTVEGLVALAQGAPHVLYARALEHHFDGRPSGLQGGAIVRASPRYAEALRSITNVLTDDFRAARDASLKELDPYRQVWDFGRTWDSGAYAASRHPLMRVRKDLGLQKRWREQLDKMKSSLAAGCLLVDVKPLRAALHPVCTTAQDAIKVMLLERAREATVDALEDLQARIALLQQRPAGLEEYMQHHIAYHEQLDARKALADSFGIVNDMYECLAVYGQKVPLGDAVKRDDLTEAYAAFQQTLKESLEFLADHKEAQLGTLRDEMAATNAELAALADSLKGGVYTDPASDPEEVVSELEAVLAQARDAGEALAAYNAWHGMFDLPPDDGGALMLAEREANERYELWRALRDFVVASEGWMDSPMLDDDGRPLLHLDAIRAEVDDVAARAYKAAKERKDDPVVGRLRSLVDEFREVLPLIEELATPALQNRHWSQLLELLGADVPPNEDGSGFAPFSLRELCALDPMSKLDQLQAVSSTASKEWSLEKALVRMQGEWAGATLRVVPYKDTGTAVIGGTDDIQTLLDDHTVKTLSMRASPFVKPLEERVLAWDAALSSAQELMDSWLTCQKAWQYLEPIFSSADILKQMPTEGRKFQQVDGMWRDLMDSAAATPLVLRLAEDPARREALAESNALLEDIQKGLSAYLEVKRLAFPRFFFLSNDEMLEILSETKDPTRVQPHLRKCFEGIAALRFEPRGDISGLVSAEGEVVSLETRISPAAAQGAVEKWLVQVEAGMVASVRAVLQRGLAAYPGTPRSQWVLQWPGQVVLAVTGIAWTQDIAAAICSSKAGALDAAAAECTRQLNDIVALVRAPQSPLNRATLSALVVMDVHARDVAAALAQEGIQGQPTHFSWLSQLRMYWEQAPAVEIRQGAGGGGSVDVGSAAMPQATVMVRMMHAQAEYGFEYLGNSSRLVVTPLTDRCYRTLIGAVHLTLGGAPEGPAGTGKTETTKDLAKALARQCVVFNCSDTLDYVTMGKFFKGLASSGAWACFDEFNRIDLEVLSVVAQQVSEIQRAVRARVSSFVFEGSTLVLRPSCNVFITMNPGYAGRSELPDNLKALFRTVAMMVPDYALIAEISLYASGYIKARECARKIVATYRLCSEQLSSQDHYDYGMRAVMAVLRAAGNLKREFPAADELELMLRAIRSVNECKFLAHDLPLFSGILSDLFPGVAPPPPDYAALHGALRRAARARGLQPTEYFLLKATQLYEMVVVRHGLMLVGQPYSGKTSILQSLAAALTELGEAGVSGPLFARVQSRTINPKAVTMGQLYGEADRATQEWRDGVLGVAFRAQAADDPCPDRKWLVLDGPVDAVWIENMNTVLDDNRKLCLPNSEIIQMSGAMTMVFEVGDLAAASPATVSRCGMVYLEPSALGWAPLLASWLQTLPRTLGAHALSHLEALLCWALPPCLRCVRKSVEEQCPTQDVGLAASALRLLAALLAEAFGPAQRAAGAPGGAQPATAPSTTTAPAARLDDSAKQRAAEGLALCALTWTVGATGDAAGRSAFDATLRGLLEGGSYESQPLAAVGHNDAPARRPALCCPLPPAGNGTLHDWCYSLKGDTPNTGGAWVSWASRVPSLSIPPGTSSSDILVPTADSVRVTFLLDLCLRSAIPLLLVGPTGTGKSTYVSAHVLNGLPQEAWLPAFVTLSARTSASMVQEQVDGRLDKRKRGVYGPPIGRRLVVFVDDLNMPAKEKYGAQPPIELLRQAMDQGGWYGRDNAWRELVDVQWVGAMGPPGGGRTFPTPRYLRHFNILALAQVSPEALSTIFTSILSWHLSSGAFPSAVRALASPLVAATLDVYAAAAAQLLPTPSKSHYTFNLRDCARVVQGVMMLPASALPAADAAATYKRLWVHEALRVFHDRLADACDRGWLVETLRGAVSAHLGDSLEALLGSREEVGPDHLRRLFFGTFGDGEGDDPPGERAYAPLASPAAALAAVGEALADHNATSKRPLPLALFQFAVEHVARVARLLAQPGGHALLVGVGGSGRQSLARLAAYLSGCEVVQVEVSKAYGRTEWREDLRRLMRRTGVDGQRVMFLFSDTQIKDESFVEDINNLLNAGEVPNLFPQDERMQILEAVRPAAARAGCEAPHQVWSHFVGRVRRALHVVLAMSPVGGALRERLRANPSLVNCCTINWFDAWPEDALAAVAAQALAPLELGTAVQAQVVAVCQTFHTQVSTATSAFLSELGRHTYVTPTSYLELLGAFRSMLEDGRSENARQRARYATGLSKLAASAAAVAVMQGELVALQPQLVATVGEVEALLARIDSDRRNEVEPRAALVAAEQARAQDAADAAGAIKRECEADLAQALPILHEALAALDTIKEADISYIRKLPSPPTAVKLVMEAVCVLLEVKPAKTKDEAGREVRDFWKPAQALLNERDFLQRLKGYDKDAIPPRLIAAIRETYLTQEGFTPEVARHASSAAEGMCKWVHAMSSYDQVAKVVAPKRAKLAEAEAAYAEVVAGLEAKQRELQVLLDRLAAMQSDLEHNQSKKVALERDIEGCRTKLGRAEALLGGLAGEKARWAAAADALDAAQVALVGDMLIGAGVVAYLGPFTPRFRQQMLDGFLGAAAEKGLPHSPRFSVASVLGDPLRIRRWLAAGLPNDGHSIENAIIVAKARRWPLCIDPQGQANKWVRQMEAPNHLQVAKLSRGGELMQLLENAVQFGQPVLLEGVGEELPPALESLLLRQTFKSSGVECIRLGDATVEYSHDFRFYITTKLRNPHFLPEVAVKVSLLNFAITLAGLADQLLGVVVSAERPELERQKAQLVQQGAANAAALAAVEERILSVLSASSGNILDDETAIAVITQAKALGNDVAEKQAQAAVTEGAIDAARRAYASAGDYASTLFFAITDLGLVDPMYQYSLPWFTGLLLASLAAAEHKTEVPARLAAIADHFTAALYRNVCRSLFEKDKLLFAFLLAARLLEARGALASDEYLFLLTGGLGANQDVPNPVPGWLPDGAWRTLLRLSGLPVFAGLPAALAADPTPWEAVYASASPHNEPLPGEWGQLSDFRRLLVLRCLRPDKLVPAVTAFVGAQLGPRYTVAPPFSLADCYADSSAITPIVFVLSPGSDPTELLLQFAGGCGMSSRLSAISLGQGQGPKAAALIAMAAQAGSWVVLQNCHLAPSWMPELDRICEQLAPGTTHPEFRLWMTSYPSAAFPVNILQSSVKLTTEPPSGLSPNMARCLASEPLSDDAWLQGSRVPRTFKALLFGLILFHAQVLERRKYGPLGWNIPYGFDDGDLRISATQLRMFVDDAAEVAGVASDDDPAAPWLPLAALRYTAGECNYGGRVTDDRDRRLLSTLLARCYCADVVDAPGYDLTSGGAYRAPLHAGQLSREQLIAHVAGLPPATPAAFGLGPNADITRDLNDTARLLSALLATNGGGGGGGGGGAAAAASDARVATLASEVLTRLPSNYDLEAISGRWPVRYEASMSSVLVQECARFNRLLDVLRGSLSGIKAALAGLAVMSSELEAAARQLALNQVPDLWRRASYPSLCPLGSYLEDLWRRLAMLTEWDARGPPPSFWLPGFFFPQSFLTAGLQDYARRTGLPVDAIAYDFETLAGPVSAHTSPPPEGVVVHGLWLEGAGWDHERQCLAESRPKELFAPAPVLWFRPKQLHELSAFPHCMCPLYRTAERRGTLATTGHSTNFVLFVKLPSGVDEAHWVLRGVAMLAQLSD